MELLNTFIFITGITANPRSSTIVALNDITFTCSPISNEPEEYSWHRVDGDVPSHSSGQNTNRLTIHRVLPADEGQYYCMGKLSGHCAVSNNVIVTVEGKKMVVHNQPTYYAI